jgi:hypothetical protein
MGATDVKLAWALSTLIFAVSSFSVCSCALIFQGTTEQIDVASDPPGATVTFNDGETKVTPFTVTVPREKDLEFHFSKSGYQSADLDDDALVEPGYMTADLLPLMLPWAIDAASGAGFAHEQTSVSAHLDPEGGSAGDATDKASRSLAPATAAQNTAGKTAP